MAKKKKTRQQKIIADLRRQLYTSQAKDVPLEIKTENNTQSLSITLPKMPKINTTANRETSPAFTNTYPYLAKDLRKTAIVTTAILAAQLLLFFTLVNHIIVFPGLTY